MNCISASETASLLRPLLTAELSLFALQYGLLLQRECLGAIVCGTAYVSSFNRAAFTAPGSPAQGVRLVRLALLPIRRLLS